MFVIGLKIRLEYILRTINANVLKFFIFEIFAKIYILKILIII